jgi:hypothetical protein
LKITKHEEKSNWIIKEINHRVEVSLTEKTTEGFIFVGTLDDMFIHVKNVLKKKFISVFTRREISARIIIQFAYKYNLNLEDWS